MARTGDHDENLKRLMERTDLRCGSRRCKQLVTACIHVIVCAAAIRMQRYGADAFQL